ncbi:hypothetical protein GF420_03740 [candidate division GN15 bacterium]|nr:hypothetical protein [candidate division GN15 bacterium]
MRDFLNAFLAERMKLKRTLALWLVLLTPLLVAGIQLMILANMDKLPWEGVSGWVWLQRSVGPIWSLFVFPMLIAVVTALHGAVEHTSGGWRRIFALPTSRPAICLAKLGWAHVLLLLTNLWLVLLLVGVGLLWHQLKPSFGFAGIIPSGSFLLMAVKFYLAAGFVISFQYWLANRSASFALALGIGIGGTFVGMVQATGWYQKLFPWKYMINTQAAIEGVPELALALGISGGIVLGALSVWDLARRDIT